MLLHDRHLVILSGGSGEPWIVIFLVYLADFGKNINFKKLIRRSSYAAFTRSLSILKLKLQCIKFSISLRSDCKINLVFITNCYNTETVECETVKLTGPPCDNRVQM